MQTDQKKSFQRKIEQEENSKEKKTIKIIKTAAKQSIFVTD